MGVEISKPRLAIVKGPVKTFATGFLSVALLFAGSVAASFVLDGTFDCAIKGSFHPLRLEQGGLPRP